MRRAILCKLLQRQTYNILSQRHLLVISLLGLILFAVSAIRFCEVALEWSRGKYMEVFNRFSDNIVGQNFQERLCQHLPIDAVYTWVNGSDPELVRNLSAIREQMMLETNKSGSSACQYKMCVPAPIVILKHLTNGSSLPNVSGGNIRKLLKLQYNAKDKHHCTTAVLFSSLEAARHSLMEGRVSIAGRNVSVGMTFVTTDSTVPNTVLLEDMLMMTGIPSGVSESDIAEKLSYVSRDGVANIYLYRDESLALLLTTGKAATEALTKANLSLKTRLTSISRVWLVLEPLMENEDILASRFADNDELKYSLRSLQRHAPWVRKVYIITNGQIPSWLNLDMPRVTVVTHQEIFPNQSHLPTFSSPAIETHLHRIPGISKRFIYLNDDVMFGKDVWPEDFFTQAAGYKVRLAWPVPDCAIGCPTTWVKDGYCDKACNNSKCEWDGGDCLGSGTATPRPHSLLTFLRPDIQKMYCSTSCANSWLADKYCDQACNVRSCAFDAGDCGTGSYHFLHGLALSQDERNYTMPPGHLFAYFNLTGFLDSDTKITDGHFEENEAVRVVAVSIPNSVMTVVLFPNYNATQIHLTLKGVRSGVSFEFQFTLNADTSSWKSGGETTHEQLVTTAVPPGSTTEEDIAFTEFPDFLRYPPQPELVPDRDVFYKYSDLDVKQSELPDELVVELNHCEALYSSGLLTLKGFRKKKSQIVDQFLRNATADKAMKPKLVFSHLKSRTEAVDDSVGERMPGRRSLLGLWQGGFRWERQNLFAAWTKPRQIAESWTWRHRRLLDTFGDSLRHVNRLFNSVFGYEARKVPSHMAHMVDTDVMRRLQERFADEFDRTSSHKVRSPDDMQFGFSYFYFLMSEKRDIEPEEIFDAFDVDSSGTWSDREIRTVVTHLFDLPVDFNNVRAIESQLTGCTQNWTSGVAPPTPQYERYVDSQLPTITREAVANCGPMVAMLRKIFKTMKVNKFETIKEEDYAFRMIDNNASHVLAQLDELRKTPKKFICLNDNIDHSSKESDMVKAVLRDFYESLFPTPSQFELPPEYRNRYLRMEELREWRAERNLMHAIIYVVFGVLVALALTNFFSCSVGAKSAAFVRLLVVAVAVV